MGRNQITKTRSAADFMYSTEIKDIQIKENSWIAKVAAKKLRVSNMAIVIGKTIHLHNVTRQDFLHNKRWLQHEMCHVRQYKRNGFLAFLIKYIWQSITKGYFNNKYEIEARQAENL